MTPYEDFKYSLTSLETVDSTNYLLEVFDYCLDILKNFGEGDIRYDYFALTKDIIINFNLHLKNFWLRAFIDYEKDKDLDSLNKKAKEDFKGDFDHVFFRYRSVNTNLSRNLIVEFWSLFEYVITVIYEHVFTEKERVDAGNKYKKIFSKILKKHLKEVNSDSLEVISNELCSKTDSFVPTINKVNKIFKKTGESYEGKQSDIEFLTFFSRLRNGIHCNFIYKGVNKEPFIFNGNTYQFEDGKVIVEKLNKQFDEMEILNYLLLVILRYFESLKIKRKIPNWMPTISELEK